ncbi:dUTPase [Pseudomonas phage vB_PpuM-Kassivere]
MKVGVKQLSHAAKLPTYGTEGAAGFDISTTGFATIDTNSSWTFATGLAFEVPEDHVMLVFSRSGHGFKSDVRLANCVGVIDSDYRGELFVKLTNDGDDFFTVHQGDRIAQGLILPVERVEFEMVQRLSDTARGEGGFGSTGVA